MIQNMDPPESKHRPSISPEPPRKHYSVPQKRKAPSERGDSSDDQDYTVGGESSLQKDEYETGRVICEVCGEGVSFRDEATGGFTLKHWDAHRQQCSTTTQAPPEPVIYTPESTAEALANPPTKRRRAKRTEEERIDYLRADPYVAQFEAYRVLCASCDKWIRLRPNSTYCSIPWDAHRKSCLSKKINSKNVYALEERNSMFAKDPDIRKFDAERVLCNSCDRWIPISPEDHMQAVQKWLQHRSTCQKLLAAPPHEQGSSRSISHSKTIDKVLPLSEQPYSLASNHNLPRHGHRSTPDHSPSGRAPAPLTAQAPSPSSSFKDLTPTSFPPAHESRRRNAEQRAATLKSDPLVREVEPNRVFCSLCKKWVQLRQDSSYCAYPWLQHRGKCLARHERRVQKAAELAEMRAKRGDLQGEDELLSPDEDDSMEDDLESDDGAGYRQEILRAEERRKAKYSAKPDSRSLLYSAKKHRVDKGHRQSSPWSSGEASSSMRKSSHMSRPPRLKGRHDLDSESQFDDAPATGVTSRLMRRLTLDFADLDSVPGRMKFIFSSIALLFATTYENTDDMTISSLLSYLNTAMPPDKHEDFDTSEVAKAVAALQERGDIIFEGDMLRLPD
ncbi:hypothetical protein SERLA73DRAFT_161883 [Serpula lacrymans var. lacrymans S7.3]|uniref:Uncharacterized protein n=2 Tax=Serpula lacrymans var. lacrymans TaxID=341189 RepID=F8Q488_SERL3|nr:uncharacterized protein SERLADRAFT_416970 [Serpula lacrymans var. lacrymans S7.9]EGN96943.1 hypothetical protein SERLA73DRAFT_161883 [Serpula lacrymans var. lacrymans S7.3]EGO22535.1 hypothetical protein SERLADRAFT_416970 [Serpula lacrymans var. lacrymans S7.9]